MDTAELARFAVYGIEKMIGELQGKLAEARAMESHPVIKTRRGRPPKALLAAAGEPWAPAEVMAKAARMGWSADPEERSREMKRRRAKWNRPKIAAPPAKLHPRDAGHPNHAKWLAATRRARKKAWATMTPEQRTALLTKMNKGRAKLAVAS